MEFILNQLFQTAQKLIYTLNTYLLILLVFIFPIYPKNGKKLLVVIFLFWLITLDYKKLYYTIKDNKAIQYYLLFLSFFLLSFFWSQNQTTASTWAFFLIKNSLIPMLIFITLINTLNIKYIVYAFILSMLCNELISYSIFFFDITNVFGYQVKGDPSNPIPFQNSHMEYSTYIAFTVFLSIYSFFNVQNIYLKSLYLIFIITMLFNLFLSIGRTGQFTFVLTSLVLLFIYFRKKIKILISLLITLIIIVLIAYNTSNTFNKRINQTILHVGIVFSEYNFYSSIGVRLSSYIVVPNLIKDDNTLTIAGTGLGDQQDLTMEKQLNLFGKGTIFDDQDGHLHNTYFSILISTGILGLGLYLLFIFNILKIKLDHKYTYIKLAFILTIFFSSFAENLLRQTEILFLLALFTGIFVNLKKEN